MKSINMIDAKRHALYGRTYLPEFKIGILTNRKDIVTTSLPTLQLLVAKNHPHRVRYQPFEELLPHSPLQTDLRYLFHKKHQNANGFRRHDFPI